MSRQRKVTEDEVYAYLMYFIEKHGFSPTVREIQDGLGISSPSLIQSRLRELHDNERITHIPGSPRTIRLVRR